MHIVSNRRGWWIVEGSGEEYTGPYAEYTDAKRALDEFERADATKNRCPECDAPTANRQLCDKCLGAKKEAEGEAEYWRRYD